MFRPFALIVFASAIVGCGAKSTAVITQDSEVSYQSAVQAFEQKDFEGAVKHLDSALSRGGLNADLAGQALFMRAKCHLELGRLDEAQRDLDAAREGPVPAEEVLAAKAELAMKRGDLEKARNLYAKAQKINPALALPDKLR